MIIFAYSDKSPEQDRRGECSHEGIDVLQDERRWKPKNRSSGIVFVNVERSDRMECRASRSTTSHWESDKFLDLVFQMILLRFDVDIKQ